MVSWQYRIVLLSKRWDERAHDQDLLDSLGKQGWELVVVVDDKAYLKRRMSDSE